VSNGLVDDQSVLFKSEIDVSGSEVEDSTDELTGCTFGISLAPSGFWGFPNGIKLSEEVW
jgi:hypothetical protein